MKAQKLLKRASSTVKGKVQSGDVYRVEPGTFLQLQLGFADLVQIVGKKEAEVFLVPYHLPWVEGDDYKDYEKVLNRFLENPVRSRGKSQFSNLYVSELEFVGQSEVEVVSFLSRGLYIKEYENTPLVQTINHQLEVGLLNKEERWKNW